MQTLKKRQLTQGSENAQRNPTGRARHRGEACLLLSVVRAAQFGTLPLADVMPPKRKIMEMGATCPILSANNTRGQLYGWAPAAPARLSRWPAYVFDILQQQRWSDDATIKHKGTHPLVQLMLGGEDADLVSGSFPGLPGNGRVPAGRVAAPRLSRKLSAAEGSATAVFCAGVSEQAAAPPASFCGGAVGNESLARLRSSFCWRCCCLSSMGLKRRLGFPSALPTIPGDLAAEVFCACWPFLLLLCDRSADARRGLAPFSVVLLSGAGCCCCTTCSASSPPHTIATAAVTTA